MKVNTLIIGAARSATTSLSQILDQHPDICLSRPKEPQFFSDPDWREKIETYHNCFHEEAKIYLDASTNYSKYPAFNKHIHQDIKEYNVSKKAINLIDLLFAGKLITTKSEGRRLLSQGAIRIDQKKIKGDFNLEISPKDGMILQAGKRKFLRLKVKG